ncbi:ABC transporter permease subunit [Xinfangfangia sp. CPCC 101601]|uniref:ABC transporter permease subunit n=1 Tax=Pseudogemmobacter lacusdianii TaxID=3069608 RepID=A0ABU0VWP6_9RHOB|nr:ABC transporter permease subunit [Xinfangfangia sp. CPCC 101601]MDQ2066138.1 ABC transporter permease subunit [Xinfangfangia sp. CPCC 101601]
MENTLGLLALSPPGWGGTLLAGLWASMQIAVGAFGLGLIIGLGGAYGKIYGGPVLRDCLGVYTTVVRALPELILILLLYFGLTDIVNQIMLGLGYDRVQISGVVAGVLVLGVVQGAYATEVLRGAILAVPPGQIEAARAMGMPAAKIARRITIPTMLGLALPGLSNLWLIATKDTALLAIVGFSELTLATRQAAGTTKAFFTFFLAAGAIYLAISMLSTWGFARLERWARRGDPPRMTGGT